ncbi:NADH-quinone oxidoreductase subunit NuoG [Nisaea acidiphila]|uniref:NADH-quinone oxidoreductase n=1 Tax=Nisaea acidiphila TaxID=1862145 RepID=A0A9J7AUW1_9PROT|nr:NADH-quinone oxidoreductase subunit NuoG [Nisaea acidiphila]UUX50249.1 NADH-quinone oxidoreductase subunit NuoG [Nisaea acidiphila]
MPKLTVNGVEVEVPAGASVLQACEKAGAEIPRFCYHERLSIAGNCRMCLVEMERSPKPVASCAMPAGDGMVIRTDSELVKKAREGVMEFLLINHPLDCPICDQGGECDLQDQAMAFGQDCSRFDENKRAVEDKYMGPLVKTIMTRCIHCTRCVRFSTEVAGVTDMGLLGRGENAEITTYLEKAIDSEMSANVIDLCPVGALTSKPYAFVARPWELRKTESVDVMDAVGSNIRVDARGGEVLRVLPRLHEDVNEEWISDKTRYACDGLKRQRLDRPYIRKDGKLQPASWEEALTTVAAKLKGLKGGEIAAIAGDTADVESMYALKGIMTALGSPNLDCRQDGAKLDATSRAGYLFNSTIAGIEDADAILIVGANPRWDAAVLNTRIRKRWLAGGLKVGLIGAPVDLTYEYDHLGAGPQTLGEVADGKHAFASVLKDAERPMIILGMGALARDDGGAVLATARKIAESTGMLVSASKDEDGNEIPAWNGFNILHTAAARVGGLDLGFLPGEGGADVAGILEGASKGAIKAVYLLGADEIDTQRFGDAFVIYQGHHGDRGAHRADVILPGAAYTEKDALYVNTEGRVQLGLRAAFPPGEAREDWAILRALSAHIGNPLPFDSLEQLRAKLRAENEIFTEIDVAPVAEWGPFGTEGAMGETGFGITVENFYMTDPISRASKTMAECTEVFVLPKQGRTGTEG